MPRVKSTSVRQYGEKKRSRKQQLCSARKKRKMCLDENISTTSDVQLDITSEDASPEREIESALQQKFRLFEELLNVEGKDNQATEDDSSNNSKPNYVFIDTVLINTLVANLGCSQCKSFGNLKIVIDKQYLGLASKLSVICSYCEAVIVKTATSQRCAKTAEMSKKTAFEINRRGTLAAIYSGYGHSGMKKFSMIMGMPALHQKTFSDHVAVINKAVQETVSDKLRESAECVRNAYAAINVFPDEDGILDISVSYDGSWMRRGHVSNFGVGVAIDLLTGFVLDFQVLSRYCHTCALKEKKLSPAEFLEWFEKHKSLCHKTFHGTAGAMEPAAALAIWKRSVELHNFRYTEVLSDGDAKTFLSLTEANVYGEEHVVTKEECVNHVGKRMFTALQKAVVESKGKGIILGGKGEGRLTKNVQEKLANYYRTAIRNNSGDLQAMRNAVFATLFHSISTDDEPHHSRCPTGPDTWCFFNKSLALGKTPGKHADHIHTHIKKQVAEKIIPIYQRLGDEALLRRCLKGKTQNANESLHSVIWQKCPKTSFLHLDRVTMGVGLAVIDFNYGRRGLQNVMLKLGIQPGFHTVTAITACDTRRGLKSAERATSKARTVRERKHLARVQLENKLQQEEGGPSYEAGGFS